MEKKEKKFEDQLKELETIVKDLESGDINLDDALHKFNEAMLLAKECTTKLKKVEENVNKILTDDGKLETFKIEE